MADLISFFTPLSILIIIVFILVASASRHQLRGRKFSFPPGPPGFPVIGNVSFLFNKFPWIQFTQWHRIYGPIVHINVAGRSLLVLNTAEIAFDLLDRRGSNYTDRPRLIMAGELLAGGIHIGFVPHGALWRKLRRASHMSFNVQACEAYFRTQELEAAFLINRLLNNSSVWEEHIQLFSASTILTIVYGRPPTTSIKDPLILRVNNFMDCMLKAAMPGNYWVDLFPILNSLPSWMAPFKAYGMRAHQEFTDLFNQLLQSSSTVQKNDQENPSFCAKIIDEYQQIGLSEKEAAWLAGAMFGAGSDTTSAVLIVFVLAMLLNPIIMRNAQREVDDVIGHDRFPTFSDRTRLPYVNAIVKETLRWRPITPLGLARQTQKDDIYNGYHIPAGSTIMTNVWAMNHNADIYPNPSAFNPERFLDEELKEVKPEYTRGGTHAFGFGRRACVGASVATNSVFIIIAHILWAFDISPSDSTPLPSPDDMVDTGVVVRPAPFSCRFILRHEAKKNMIDTFIPRGT